MTRPEDIPEDVWERAEKPAWMAVHSMSPMRVEIARAILAAEQRGREEAAARFDKEPQSLWTGEAAAAAIRRGTP